MTMKTEASESEPREGESNIRSKELSDEKAQAEQSREAAKNGRQKGADNVERLRKYLERLKDSGVRLPAQNGGPDKSAIALAAGFNRQTLYNNPAASALLEDAVRDIGLEGDTKVVADDKAAHMQRQMGKRDRRIQQLEEMLDARTAEVRELKEKLRQYSLMEEIMTANGRRFRP